MTESLLALPERFDQLTKAVDELVIAVRDLAAAQQHTDERLNELAVAIRDLTSAQQRTDGRLAELTKAQRRTEAQIAELVEAQQRTESTMREIQLVVKDLANWQRGEAGRRDGERCERDVARRSPSTSALQRRTKRPARSTASATALDQLLRPLLEELETKREADPFLADLIQWKGETVIVVEVFNQINGYDVIRAANRAETLRRAGAQAMPIVIGAAWASDESSYEAKLQKIEWKTEYDVSEGFLRPPPPAR